MVLQRKKKKKKRKKKKREKREKQILETGLSNRVRRLLQSSSSSVVGTWIRGREREERRRRRREEETGFAKTGKENEGLFATRKREGEREKGRKGDPNLNSSTGEHVGGEGGVPHECARIFFPTSQVFMDRVGQMCLGNVCTWMKKENRIMFRGGDVKMNMKFRPLNNQSVREKEKRP